MATFDKAYISMQQRMADLLQATPRQRVSLNRSTPLTLTGSWQAIPFTSSTNATTGSTGNVNTFPQNRYDTTNNLILANPNTDFEQGYNLSLDLAVKPNNSNAAVKVQLRFMIPRPAGSGGPFYFPLPDSLGYTELPDELSGTTTTSIHFDYPLYTSALFRQYGAQLQINYRAYQMNANLLSGLTSILNTVLTGTQRPQLLDATMNLSV